ncbi:LysR family transcriptional regulator [Shewanella corallii]|uniref:LysR family transcriptional regulator n=1 Tax=Shewanella corallii TaxID=560080 RepID=A0ABT0N301_9GAMM|nr:LysR family transcriptional regulator [Shewanella corallii]MCL2912475.1 LysR family transcriptional regulator [Shewanella corallii]
MEPLLSERISLKMLRYFYQLACTEHFGKAASNLNITVSPLSSQIRELEALLTVQLFDRDSRNVRLTAAGKLLKLECELIFNTLERSLSEVQKLGRIHKEVLRIGLVSSAFWAGFGGMLSQFHKRYPQYEVELVELSPEEQKLALKDGKIDVGLCRQPDTRNLYPFAADMVTAEEFMVAVSGEHPFSDRKQVSLSELKRDRFSFMSRRNSASTELFLSQCRKQGFVPDIANEFIEPNTLMAYVSSCQTITIVPSSFARHQWENIHFIRLEERLEANLCLIYQPIDASPLVEAFVDMMKLR